MTSETFIYHHSERGRQMYIIPGYVKTTEKDDAVFLSSEILHNEVKISQPELKQELHSLSENGCSDLSTPLTKFLHEQELLENEEEAKQKIMSYQEFLNHYLMLTIMPTEGCNFRCPYCYETHQGIVMNDKTFDGIKQYVKEKIESGFQVVRINWFGGEPTLCKQKILDMGRLIHSLCQTNKVSDYSEMTTNGYLLDVDSFREYYDSGVRAYQITLDGWNHDKTRPHVSGKGTLDTILNNLKEISKLPKEQYQYHIMIRYNILPDCDDFTWYDYLKELFGKDERFGVLIRPVFDWGGDSVKELSLIQERDMDKKVEEHLEYLEKIGLKTVNGHRTGVYSKICAAAYPYGFVFRANGKIEKCTVCLDHPKNCVGYVDEKKGVILDNKTNKLWSASSIEPKCLKCPSVLSCLNRGCKRKEITEGITENDCSYILSKTY